MTTITTTCTGCGRQLAVPERYQGRDLKCPSCGRPFRADPPQAAPPPESALGPNEEVFPEPTPVPPAPAPVRFAEPPAAAPQPASVPEADAVVVESTAVYWRVQRIGVASLAALSALLHAVLGLLTGVAIAMASLSPAVRAVPFLNGPLLGILAVVVLPLAYAAVGFATGALAAAVYNLGARFLGGVRVLLE